MQLTMTALEFVHERVLAEKQIAERKLELIFDVHQIPSLPLTYNFWTN